MQKITRRKQKVLDFIKTYRAQHGFSPSVREIADHNGICISTCWHHINTLITRGLLIRGNNGAPRTLLVASQQQDLKQAISTAITALARVDRGLASGTAVIQDAIEALSKFGAHLA